METVEEVLAVVDNTPILYSDIELGSLLHLVEHQTGESDEDYRSRLLDARIRLELQFRDLETSGQLYRIDLEPGAVRESLVNRAGGMGTLGPKLESSGLELSDLDELALRLAAVDAFVTQRLRPRVSVSLEEIEAAYRRLLVDEFEDTDNPAPPLNSVSDQIHRLLVERKLNDEIERWLEQASDRQVRTRFSR